MEGRREACWAESLYWRLKLIQAAADSLTSHRHDDSVRRGECFLNARETLQPTNVVAWWL